MTFVIILCGLLISTIGLTIWENRLAKRQSWRKGLIPVIILFLLTTTVIVAYHNEVNSYHTGKLETNMANGCTAEIYVRFNEENQLIGFTQLFITDKSGQLKDSEHIYFNEKGELEGCRYSEVINKLLGKYSLSNKGSWDKEYITGNSIPLNGGYLRIDDSWQLYIWTVGPSLLIYLFSRWNIGNKRKKDQEMRIKLLG